MQLNQRKKLIPLTPFPENTLFIVPVEGHILNNKNLFYKNFKQLGVNEEALDEYDFLLRNILLIKEDKFINSADLDCLVLGNEEGDFKSVIINDNPLNILEYHTLANTNEKVQNLFSGVFKEHKKSEYQIPFYLYLTLKLE